MEPQNPRRRADVDPPTVGAYGGFTVYPMPAFVTLAAADPRRTADFFTRVLDFDVMFRGPEVADVPTLLHVRRAKYQDVLIVPSPQPVSSSESMIVTFGASDPDELDALAERVRAAAPSSLVQEPEDMPWNARQMTVRDPDGHQFRFTSQARTPRPGTIDELMQRNDAGSSPGLTMK